MLISSQAFAPKQTLVLLDIDQAKFRPLLINSIRKWSKSTENNSGLLQYIVLKIMIQQNEHWRQT